VTNVGDFYRDLGGQPLFWALVLGSLGLWLMLPRSTPRQLLAGIVFLAVAFGMFIAAVAPRMPISQDILTQVVFWFLAAVTVGSAAVAVSMRSAVYCAVWFAVSLVGTAGLFLFQGALLIGVATIVVYAGAIVVTFLFVLMLAQPEGHTTYDRISWVWYAKPFTISVAAILVGVISVAVLRLDEGSPLSPPAETQLAEVVLHKSHVARAGTEMFTRYLVSVEVAGTLLLVALVGAIAGLIHGRQPQSSQEGLANE
jgi:NADH-quinone oxidoreductase subunit J